MSREWWAGVFFGAVLVIAVATLYGIAVASKTPGASFAFMCFRA